MTSAHPESWAQPRTDGDVALVDLLDRLLAGGVVITGDVTISLADVDLVQVSLRLLVSSVNTLLPVPEAVER